MDAHQIEREARVTDRLNLSRTLSIVTCGLAALLVLWPPWQDVEGKLLGYGPLFSPLQYTEQFGEFKWGVEPTYESGGYRRDATTGMLRREPDRLVDPGRPAEFPTYATRPGVIASGRLVTQLAVLAVITGVIAFVTRRRVWDLPTRDAAQ
jgi:hypothetical protein